MNQHDLQDEVQVVYAESLKYQKVSTKQLNFMKAVQSGNVSMVNLLLQNGADIAEKNDTEKTSLHIATLDGNLKMVQVLLDMGIDIEAKDDRGMTALCYAIEKENDAIVRVLLQQGAGSSIVQQHRDGSTALHHICGSGSESMVRVVLDKLVELHLNVNTPDNKSKTALYEAALSGHSAVTKMLLAAGADVTGICHPSSDDTTHPRATALQAAARLGHETVIDTILSTGYKPTDVELVQAIKSGHENIVRKLLDADANINANTNITVEYTRCFSGLQVAAASGHKEIVEMLLAAGANVNTAVALYNGKTALQAAAEGGYKDIVEILLSAGADVNSAASYHGKTALQAATRNGHKEIADFLVRAGAVK